MSTYYQYQDAKLAIIAELANRGWTIYGYSPDESDSMTDYYCPAHWDGIAEKNGYILVIDHARAGEPVEIKEYINSQSIDISLHDKIKKLRAMTIENGATEGEAASARMRLEAIEKKLNEQTERAKEYKVTGIVPGYMANPPRCNWHLEKDGAYILKGNGILKYSTVYNEYYHYSRYKKNVDLYIKSREEWIKEVTQSRYFYDWETEEQRAKKIESNEKRTKEVVALLEGFRKWIRKIDAAAGCSIGKEAEKITYEKVKVTEYKTEYKAFETEQGEVKEEQCFVLKANFNYGHNRGQVFRIHERIHEEERGGQKYYYAYKLNRKRTKELTGMADTSNRWYTFNEKFEKWIKEGAIAFCEIREVKTPYEVEKVIKKVEKVEDETETKQEDETECSASDNKAKTEAKTEAKAEGITQYTYDIKQDTDTRDNSKIWVVKVLENLDRQAYISLNKYMRGIGAYYSKFKHGFLFKTDPTNILTGA